MINSIKIIKAIAFNTFRETIRDKVLYSMIAFSVLVLAASVLAGSVSLDQNVRVIQNFSLTAIIFFVLIITVFIGTQLMFREIERKTIYISISKPITREQFYLGKYFGLATTITVTTIIMSLLYLTVLKYQTNATLTPSIWAILFILLEGWLLVAVSLLFSTFSSPISSAVYTLCLALIGHSSATFWNIIQKSTDSLKGVLQFVYYVFPNLEKFNLRNEVVYGLNPESIQVWAVVGYFVAYTLALLLVGMGIFRKDEF